MSGKSSYSFIGIFYHGTIRKVLLVHKKEPLDHVDDNGPPTWKFTAFLFCRRVYAIVLKDRFNELDENMVGCRGIWC